MVSNGQLRDFADFANDLAAAGGDIIRAAVSEPLQFEMKGDSSPVTAVDQAVEDRIREMIADRYPDHGIIGEERGSTAPDAEFVWIIDPIDGTLPFLAGIPVFGTLVALAHGETPVIGVIDMPMTGERWIGAAGQATTRNGAPVRTRPCDDLASALMSTSSPDWYGESDRPALERMRMATRWRVYGGSCLSYAQLASGRIDVGMDVSFDIFDYLALVPVIQGAGGTITDWAGAPLTLRSGDRFVACGDPRMQARVLEILIESQPR